MLSFTSRPSQPLPIQHAKLDEIALRPTNLQFADYLKLLIEQEKLHKRTGFEGRIEQLFLMLDQAKIRNDIVSKKYDPIAEWKTNVEKELAGLDTWEEAPEGGEDVDIMVHEDHGDDGESTSEDDTSDESETDDEVYEGAWQERPTLSQLVTPNTHQTPNFGTPLPPQETDITVHRRHGQPVQTPSMNTPNQHNQAYTPQQQPRRSQRKPRGGGQGTPGGGYAANPVVPTFQDPSVRDYNNNVPVMTHDPQTGLWHTPQSQQSTPYSGRRGGGGANGGGTRVPPEVPVWDGVL